MTRPRSRAVCVLGMHRSGTSVIARAMNLLGVYLGEERWMMPPAVGNNAEGFWEHVGIVDLHDEILKVLGRTWDANVPLPERWWEHPQVLPLKAQLLELVREQFADVSLWGWKDPRTCILLPMWEAMMAELGIELQYVIVVRNPLDVISSLERRDGIPRNRSAGIWHLHTLSSWIGSVGQKRVFVHYDHFLEDWETNLRRIAQILEIPWPDDAENLHKSMRSFLKPGLRHSRNDLAAIDQDAQVPTAVAELYRLCLEAEGLAEGQDAPHLQEQAERLHDEYHKYIGMVTTKWEPYQMGLYWPDEKGLYDAERLIEVPVTSDGQFHEYEMVVPEELQGTVRLDPLNLPGYIEIQSIEWSASDAGERDALATEANHFAAIKATTGVVWTEEARCVRLYTTDLDPQLFLHLPDLLPAGGRLRIVMAVHPLPQQMLEAVNDQRVRMDQAFTQLQVMQNELQAIKDDLARSDLLVGRQATELTQLRQEANEKEARLGDQTMQLHQQSELLRRTQAELEVIHRSGGWRALLAYYRLRDRLFPAGSLQRKGVKRLLGVRKLSKKSVQYIRLYGIKGFVKKVQEKARPEQKISVPSGPIHVPESMIVKYQPAVHTMTGDHSVSVVIPTLNAGGDFEPLVSTLQNQRGFKEIEIVVVDSGSTDDTVELANEYGCKLVQIRPEEFSHSYARNLGAEHATGDYLLFTTQDALPPTDQWLYELYSVLQHNDVMAVSCAETPREDADLFYRLICWNHYRFLEVNEQDRVMAMPQEVSHLTLRKNGQLSDIANLISKEVFDRYKYRFNYAEDLDLGIRLIQDGHRIAFLGSTRVIHSHLRPAYYFLKRGYVDNLFLSDIFEDFPIPMIQVRPFLRDILYVYDVITSLVRNDLAYLPESLSIDSFIERVNQRLEFAKQGKHLHPVGLDDNLYADEKLMAFLHKARNWDQPKSGDTYDGILLPALQGFLSITFEYIRMAYEQVTESLLEDFKSSIYKEFALLSGAHLAYAYLKGKNEDRELLEQINAELKKGV